MKRNNSVFFLDGVREFPQFDSDYKIARFLGKRPSYISNIRAGKSILPNEHVIALCESLKIQPDQYVMMLTFDRADSEREKAFWEKIFGSSARYISEHPQLVALLFPAVLASGFVVQCVKELCILCQIGAMPFDVDPRRSLA